MRGVTHQAQVRRLHKKKSNHSDTRWGEQPRSFHGVQPKGRRTQGTCRPAGKGDYHQNRVLVLHLKAVNVLVETVKVLILGKPAKRFIWHLRVKEPRVRKVDLAAGGGEKIYEIQHSDFRSEYQVRALKKGQNIFENRTWGDVRLNDILFDIWR